MLLKGVLPICQHLESQYLCIVFVDGICMHSICAWYLCIVFVQGICALYLCMVWTEELGGLYFCINLHFVPGMDSPSGGGWHFWTGAAAAGFGSVASPAVAISGALQATFAM